MIIGILTSNREAVIPVRIRGMGNQEIMINAAIDTGFNGFLSIPLRYAADLNLQFACTTRAVLGDGKEVSIDMYEITVVWDGQERTIGALAVDSEPLVGMAMLSGYRVILEIEENGNVTIEKLK